MIDQSAKHILPDLVASGIIRVVVEKDAARSEATCVRIAAVAGENGSFAHIFKRSRFGVVKKVPGDVLMGTTGMGVCEYVWVITCYLINESRDVGCNRRSA